MKKLKELFDNNGMCLLPKEKYFDEEDGNLIDRLVISYNFEKYPAKSDIVKMYYAEEYASETHGNYRARTLFYRAY